MRKIAPLALVGMLLLVAGCGQENSSDNTLDEKAVAGLAEHANCESCSHIFGPETLTASTPSTTYNVGEIDGMRVSTVLVAGRFTGWSRGPAHNWDIGDGDAGKVVDWDSAEAETRIIKMELAIDSVIDAWQDTKVADTETVWVVAHTGHDPEAIAQGLIDLGDSVVFLATMSDPDGVDDWRIALEGGLVGDLHDDGSFTMPVLEHLKDTTTNERFTHLEIDATTIAELERAAENPQTIEL